IAEQSETTKTVIGQTDSALWGGYINNIAETRLHETNLGDLICDSMISETDEMVDDAYKSLPVVAVVNGGGIRATIPAGDITWGNVIDVLPFSNTIMYTEVTPKVIYEMLEHSVASINSQDKETGLINAEMSGGFLQVGGMSFEYNPNDEDGSKVIAVYLDGSEKALGKTDESTKIVLASNDYIIAGGDGYDMLGSLKKLGEGRGLAEILMDYIKDTTVSYPVTNNRIRPVSEYKAKDYTANMYVKNPDSTPLKNKEITYSVDGVENKGKTNTDGILAVTVSDGPHTVSLGTESVYINNYSGTGIIEVEGDYPIPYPTIIINE
ncbi:MAG: 5'-nucleotidase C-terminal domain-containing protein, partial [Clostridia bacterium]|nr:5'-nucleotidase C-terminal domain-containing protein [Clostridia bacterium]